MPAPKEAIELNTLPEVSEVDIKRIKKALIAKGSSYYYDELIKEIDKPQVINIVEKLPGWNRLLKTSTILTILSIGNIIFSISLVILFHWHWFLAIIWYFFWNIANQKMQKQVTYNIAAKYYAFLEKYGGELNIAELSKMKITANEVGKQFVEFVLKPDNESIKKLGSDTDKQLVQKELTYLKAFIVLSLTKNFFTDNVIKEAVFDSFKKNFDKNTKGLEVLNGRLNLYESVLNTPHPNGVGWIVGKEFCRLCGSESDGILSMLGAIEYAGCQKVFTELLETMNNNLQVVI